MAATSMVVQKIKNTLAAQSSVLEVAPSTMIYEGTLVSINGSGLAINGITTSRLAGVAQNDAAEGEFVTVWMGASWWFDIASPVETMLGTTLYAADNITLQTSSNTAIAGRCMQISTTQALVLLNLMTVN
jgi:hypothetical protein